MNVVVLSSLFWFSPTFHTKDVGRSSDPITFINIEGFWRRYFCAYRGAAFATAGNILNVCDQGSKRRNEEKRKKIKPEKVVWGYMVK